MHTSLHCRIRAACVVFAAVCGHIAADTSHGGEAIKLAVLDFEDASPDAKYPKCNRALQSFLTTDLAQCHDITVIERARLDSVKQELDLSGTGFLDPKQAVAVGKQLQADAVLTGSVWVADDQMRLDARLVHTETGTVILGENIEGDSKKFSSLQKQLLAKLIDSLGVKLSAFERASLDKKHTDSLRAANMFGMALAAEDWGDMASASAYANRACAEDPAFVAAREVAASLDAMMQELRNERSERLLATVAEFEDHLLHTNLRDGKFGPRTFADLDRKGNHLQALFQWLVNVQGTDEFEGLATAFDDFFPGVRIWPYRGLFQSATSVRPRTEGTVGACYLELGAAEALLFWCDVALSDERYAPRAPVAAEPTNPHGLATPARGPDITYFHSCMPDIYHKRMQAQASLKADHAAALATLKDMDRLCRPWLEEQWMVDTLERLRSVTNDPQAFSKARETARRSHVRWVMLEQDLVAMLQEIQQERFGRGPESSRPPDFPTLRDGFRRIHAAEGAHWDARRSETQAKEAVEWLTKLADGHDFIAWPLASADLAHREPPGWVVHVAGCLEGMHGANLTHDMAEGNPRRHRVLKTPELCLDDGVVPCPTCRPGRWVTPDRFGEKLRKRIPELITATGVAAGDDAESLAREQELLALLQAFCDSPVDDLSKSLRELCVRECGNDRHNRRWQAMALQCIGKIASADDVAWLADLYASTRPFDARANIAAAIGSVAQPNASAMLADWIEREPYYFVRHSLYASLARSLESQWAARTADAVRNGESGNPDHAIAALKQLADDVSKAPAMNYLRRRTLGLISLTVADLETAANKAPTLIIEDYRKATVDLPDSTLAMADALNGLAYALASETADMEEAERAARKALDIFARRSTAKQPLDDTHVLDTLALVLFKRGKLEEAKQTSSLCVSRQAGQSLEIHDHLGDILWALQEHDAARAAWQKALTLESDTSTDKQRAKQVREKLARR